MEIIVPSYYNVRTVLSVCLPGPRKYECRKLGMWSVGIEREKVIRRKIDAKYTMNPYRLLRGDSDSQRQSRWFSEIMQ